MHQASNRHHHIVIQLHRITLFHPYILPFCIFALDAEWRLSEIKQGQGAAAPKQIKNLDIEKRVSLTFRSK
jgi:hypothetical protein